MRAVAVVFLTALVLGTQAGATSAPSRNGLIAFARCCGFPGTGIYVIAPDGIGQRPLFQPKGDDAALGPPGRRMARRSPSRRVPRAADCG